MAALEKILLVDDEVDILELIRYNLEKEGYRVTLAETGEEAIEKAKEQPDLILLDLMLPGINGLDVCKLLKANNTTSKIPIIMLTAKSEETDIVTGLELGAQDYITKPFNTKVLLARARSILRHTKAQLGRLETDVIEIDELKIDPVRHEVSIHDTPLQLTKTEFDILCLLARALGYVYSREKIIENIRGPVYRVTERSIDVHLSSLRTKLGIYGNKIETIRGVGYRMNN